MKPRAKLVKHHMHHILVLTLFGHRRLTPLLKMSLGVAEEGGVPEVHGHHIWAIESLLGSISNIEPDLPR